jgi:hypothetical protein
MGHVCHQQTNNADGIMFTSQLHVMILVQRSTTKSHRAGARQVGGSSKLKHVFAA